MGKGILIIVMGMAVLIGLLIVNLNANTNKDLDVTVDYFNETQARLISNSGIEICLEKLRKEKSLTDSSYSNSLMGGTCDINISGTDSLLNISSVGKYRNVTHTTIITAERNKVKLPSINAAVYISSNNVNFHLSGEMDINGNDHNLYDTTAGPKPPLPGIGVTDPSDSAYVMDSCKSKIDNAIMGAGGAPSVSVVQDTTDWLKLTQTCIYSADYTIPSGTYSTGTVLGTDTNPKITYVNGDVNFSGTASGSGIMIVNGNLTLSGNFTYAGIIIAYGQSQITNKTTGNAGIWGGAIFVGEGINFMASGNAKFYYCSQAIENAQRNLKSSQFKITSWWE